MRLHVSIHVIVSPLVLARVSKFFQKTSERFLSRNVFTLREFFFVMYSRPRVLSQMNTQTPLPPLNDAK